MRSIAIVQLDQRRPALILTNPRNLHLLTWVTVAPITTTIRGLTSEVRMGARNGLDAECVASCDNITTVRSSVVGRTIGLLFDDQEAELAQAIGDAFDLRPAAMSARLVRSSPTIVKRSRDDDPLDP